MSFKTTEEAKRIDMKYLKNMGYLRWHCKTTINWNISGKPSGSVSATIITEWKDELPHIRLQYRVSDYHGENWKELDYKVYLESTPCTYGKERWWFRCPNVNCKKRVRIVYLGYDYFVCRKCAHLKYASQKYTMPMFKYFDRIDKAEEIASNIKRWYWQGRPTKKHKQYLRYRGL